jgi:hypothetical protein
MIPTFAPVDNPRSLSRYRYCALAVVAAAVIKMNPRNNALNFLVNIFFLASVSGGFNTARQSVGQ